MGRQTIINTNVKRPLGITLDVDEKQVYWVDQEMRTVETCLYDGSQRKTLIDTGSLRLFRIAAFNDSLFWKNGKLSIKMLKSSNHTTVLKNSVRMQLN